MGKQLIGFDFGERQLKMVQYDAGKIGKTVVAELPDNSVRNGEIQVMDAMADFIRETAGQNGMPKGDAAVILPESLVVFKNVTMPAMTVQQLTYNLPFEFHDYLTEDKTKYYFDYALKKMDYSEEGKPVSMDLLVCCCLKSTIENYRSMLQRAGYKLKIAVPVAYALSNIVKSYAEATEAEAKDYCLVDIGQKNSRVYIFHNDEPSLHRGIDLAVGDIDNAIADSCGVDIHMAHTYKLHNYNNVLESDACKDIYHSLAVEITKAVNFYNYNNREAMLTDIYLCGGGSAIAPLQAEVSEVTGLNVHDIGELYTEQTVADAGLYPAAIGACRE